MMTAIQRLSSSPDIWFLPNDSWLSYYFFWNTQGSSFKDERIGDQACYVKVFLHNYALSLCSLHACFLLVSNVDCCIPLPAKEVDAECCGAQRLCASPIHFKATKQKQKNVWLHVVQLCSFNM